MSWFDRIFRRETRAETSRTSDPYLAEFFGLRGGRLGHVNAERAGGIPVAYRSIQAKAEAIASVPCKVYRRLPDGGREAVTDHPLARVLGESFNEALTAFEGREALSAWTDLHGNAFARIEANGRGQVIALHPLLGHVAVERLPSGRLRYRHTDPRGRAVTLLEDEVLHVRHRTRDGVVGLSPLTWARESVGLALDQQEHAGAMMRNGARFSGAIVFPHVAGPEQMQNMRQVFNERYVGPDNAGKVIILDGAADFKPFSMSPKDAEFLESRKLTNLEIARLYGVPPTIVGIPDHATYSNVTQESRAFVARCLAPWARRMEQAMNRSLLTENQRRDYFIEHDLSGLLRGDVEARFQAYRVGRDGGWLSANEIRRFENMGPIEGGDIYLQPLNMGSAGNPTPGED